MFDITHLRCFVALAEELHFGRAAERLHMTQSPLSRQLQALEQIIGATLLERSSRSIRLTAAGKSFLADARSILRLSEEALLSARKIAQGEGGVIALGFIPASSYSVLPRLVSHLQHEMPHVQLILKEMVTSEQLDALTSHRLDLGIVRTPIDKRGFETVLINRDNFVVALPSKHPLVSSAQLAISDLDRQPIIMYSPMESRYHHDLVSEIFRVSDISPHFVQFAREIHTMLALVGAGIGIALVPKSATSLGFENVVLKSISLMPNLSSDLTLIWRSQNDNPAVRAFTREVLKKFLEVC